MKWDYEKLTQVLKNKGHRLTNIRLAILKLLLKKQHLNINGIIRELKKENDEHKNINVMSVYNTLDLFLQEELIYLNVFNGRDIVFELSNPVLVHLVCETCHKVIHLSEDMHLSDQDFQDNLKKLEEKLQNADFKPVHYKLEAHGICISCQEKNKKVINNL
ncbi:MULTISPECIES: Fur family transcriptional regulator [unclassified Spiroplasma]|uniref:Fur family transcriptional regulator n=1 Tax=unclassified Spiroplasma TaxID=2637901 RepID=UPI00313D941B